MIISLTRCVRCGWRCIIVSQPYMVLELTGELDKPNSEDDNPSTQKYNTISGRIPIRPKEPRVLFAPPFDRSPVDPKANSLNAWNAASEFVWSMTTEAGSDACSRAASFTSDTHYPEKPAFRRRQNTPATSRLPTQWLDSVLESSISVRDNICPAQRRVFASEAEAERLQKLDKRVRVLVPDENDNSKPWPKTSYPDLQIALTDLYARFKPYYAPFAAYTGVNRTVQLFPPDFVLPEGARFSDTIIFNIEEVLRNWNTSEPPQCPDISAGNSMLTERTFTPTTTAASVEGLRPYSSPHHE